MGPEHVMAQLIRYMARIAGEYLGGAVVVRAVIGVPSDYNASQCRALQYAGELCKLKVVLVREPELAVRAYGMTSSSNLEDRVSGLATQLVVPTFDAIGTDDDGERHIMVVDIGGGTFDVCVVKETAAYSDIQIVFTDGDARLGGDDFDDDLMKWALKEMEDHLRSPEVKGWPMSKENKRRLKLVCRKAKEQLTSSETARINFGGTVVTVSREQFNVLAFKTIERMLVPIRKCCAGAGVVLPYETLATETFKEADKMRKRNIGGSDKKTKARKESLDARVKNIRKRFENADLPDDRRIRKSRRKAKNADMEEDDEQPVAKVDEVLCIGAASWMPAVRETLNLITGVAPTVTTVDPDTAVALGAAMYAAILDAKVADTQVQSSWRVAWAEYLSKRPDLMDRVRKERARKNAGGGGGGGGTDDAAAEELEPVSLEQR